MFKIKSKEEKILDDIKKKKEQIDKLKEDIVKMGKLVLKDGKLTRIEDTPTNKSTQEEVPLPDVPVNEMEHMISKKQNISVPLPPRFIKDDIENQPIHQQPRQVPQMTQEEYNMIMRQQQQEQLYKQQQEQLYKQQQEQLYKQQQEQLYQEQQRRQQPQQFQQQQEVPKVKVTIEMVNGNVLNIQVPMDTLENFVEELNTAIDNQSSFNVGNKVLNGRNIVTYTIE